MRELRYELRFTAVLPTYTKWGNNSNTFYPQFLKKSTVHFNLYDIKTIEVFDDAIDNKPTRMVNVVLKYFSFITTAEEFEKVIVYDTSKESHCESVEVL